MTKRLNIELIKAKLEELGLNQAGLAGQLGISRETISKWLKQDYFPKPKYLLQLGKILKLKFNELVIQAEVSEPVIAFRKVAHAKITKEHEAHARNMGKALELLLPYSKNPILTRAPILKNPVYDYNYICSVAELLRKKIDTASGVLQLEALIDLLNSFNAAIIPVLWSAKENHRNGLHIYLPESETTWIFLNLDSKQLDFKFWIAHELGHILSREIRPEVAENFADDFAGAFLYNYKVAVNTYNKLIHFNKHEQLDYIINEAGKYEIAPYTIYMQINKYAVNEGLGKIELGNLIHTAPAKLDRKFNLISKDIFAKNSPDTKDYISVCENKFNSPVFQMLRDFKRRQQLTAGFIQQLFDISTIDALNILGALNENGK